MDSGLGIWWRAGDVLQAAQYILEPLWSLCLDIPAVIGKSWSCLSIPMKMQKTLHRALHRETLSLVMDTGQRSYNCVVSSKEARTKSTNWSYNPSHSQWLPKEETPAWWGALLVLDEAFKQHSHTWLQSFIRSTTGSFQKSKNTIESKWSLQSRRIVVPSGPRDFLPRPVACYVGERRDVVAFVCRA